MRSSFRHDSSTRPGHGHCSKSSQPVGTLLFGRRSELGLNFGILFAWSAINTALFPVCCIFTRWKSEGEKVKERGKPKPGLKKLLQQGRIVIYIAIMITKSYRRDCSTCIL